MIRTLAAALVATFASAAAAGTTISFDGFAHGEPIVNPAPGVTISVVGFNGPNAGIAFDTNRTGTPDPDLQRNGGWSGGNLPANTDLGTALIIPTDVTDNNGDGFVDNPNDSAAGGVITFDFASPITSFGFDAVDFEPGQAALSSIEFDDGAGNTATVQLTDLIPSSDLGNNSANRVDPITAASLGLSSFKTVEFTNGGSGALATVVTEAVPEPATLALFGLGGTGVALLAARRRRQAAVQG